MTQKRRSSSNRTRAAWWFLAATLALSASLSTQVANAADVLGPEANGLRRYIDLMRDPLRSAYFDEPLTRYPQSAPDGGLYWQWRGHSGEGGVYRGPSPSITTEVYGAIYEFFARTGYQATNGYPTTPEEDASFDSPCHDSRRGIYATRHQRFGRVRFLCFSPEHGTWLAYQAI